MRANRVGRSVVSAITQTPVSGPLAPFTTPPMSVAPMFCAFTEAASSMPKARTKIELFIFLLRKNEASVYAQRMPVRAVLIDLDGTLADTAGDLAAAANRMLAELGLPQRTVDEVATYV